MDTSSPWETSLSALLEILQRSLSALAPILEEARISWRDGESYDDWDSIATNLFDNIVVNSLRFSREIAFDLVLPDYDLLYPSYKDFDLILVEGEDIPPGTLAVFIGLAGTSPDFSTIKWVEIDPGGTAVVDEVRQASLVRSHLVLLHAGTLRIDRLTVDL